MTYQDELSREAKTFVLGWQYITEDIVAFFRGVATAVGLKR
jgi:hypothetical protein